MMNKGIALRGTDLEPEDVLRVARDPGTPVHLDPEARERIRRARDYVEERVARGGAIYGINTGFGRLADVLIPAEQRRALQRNLLRSHAAGVGGGLPEEEVRAIILLRANALARGNSGVRPVVIERLLDLLRARIVPVVPELGSVGASGDLAPLAHIALALVGEGEVVHEGRTVPGGVALRAAGLEPLDLEEKEGLALINGTQASTGAGILALLRMESLVDLADLAGALSLEGLRGTPSAFVPQVHEVRGHPGQARSGARLVALMAGSEIRESHREHDPRVQDAYCLRCMPQVHGAAREGLSYVRRVLTVEANAVTDNPLVFPEDDLIVSAGNFHGQVVAQVLDLLALVAADLASISERRLERLLNPDLSGLPPFLGSEPGLDSGLMIVQVTVADLLAELRVLAHPASVDSVPTSANQEDHVSMAYTAARKARRSVELLEWVLAAEILAGVQAVEALRPLRSSPLLERAVSVVRREVPHLEHDRPPAPDLRAIREMIRREELAIEE